MRKIFSCCTFILFALSACQTTTERDAGRYKGSIEAITTPIVMRYRPHSESPFEDIEEMYAIIDGQKKFIYSQITRGTLSSTIHGSDVIKKGKSEFIERVMDTMGTGYINSDSVLCEFESIVTDRGIIKDFEMGFPDLDLNPSEIKILNENFKTVFKSLIPKFPENGVKDGDSLFDESIDFGQMFHDIIPEDFSVPFSISATVRGITNYKNRQTLIVDMVGNINSIEFVANFKGYSLVDVDSGVIVFSEGFIDIIEMGGNEMGGKLYTKWKRQIDLR